MAFGISSEDCLDQTEPEESKAYVKNLRVVYKLVSQYFKLSDNSVKVAETL